MINKLSDVLSDKLANYDNMPEKDIMRYSLRLIITNILTIILILAIGIITKNLSNIFVAGLSFSLLRSFTGGYHIKNPETCIIVSALMVGSIGIYSQLFTQSIVYISTFTIILTLILAPINIKHHSILDEKYHYIFKIVGVLIVVSGLFLNNIIVQMSFFIQGVTLLVARGGEIFEKNHD